MNFSKKEILEYLNGSFINNVLSRAENSNEEMKDFVKGMINTFEQQLGIKEPESIVIHYIMSMLFSALTEIDVLKEVIKQLVEKSDI